MGLPRFWGRVEERVEGPVGTEIAMGPPVGENRRSGGGGGGGGVRRKNTDDPRTALARQLSVGWTIAYYALLVVGATGFYLNLWPLTESPNALVAFAKKH